MYQTTQQAATNIVGVIRPNFGNPSNASVYKATGFASEVKDATDYNGLVEQASDEIEEYDAVVALATHLAASLQKVQQRASTLKQKAQSVKLQKLADLAKELGLGTLLEAASKHQAMNKGSDALSATSDALKVSGNPSAKRVSNGPAVHKYVIKEEYNSGVTDLTQGYTRMRPGIVAEHYRLASDTETKEMQAKRDAWLNGKAERVAKSLPKP